MKIVRHSNKKTKKQKKVQKQPNKFENRWKTRPRKIFSRYPYLMTFAQYRRNVFLTIADFRGRIKIWTSIGSGGYKNKEKIDFLAVFPVVKDFLKTVERRRLNIFFIKFKNLRRRGGARKAFRKVFKTFLQRTRKKKFRFLGCWTELHISFNGCRVKKQRRKRKRRRAKRRKKLGNFKQRTTKKLL